MLDHIYYAAPGPRTYREAVEVEDAAHWRDAIASEMASLKYHDVFETVANLPAGSRIVDSKWVLDIK